MFQKQVIAPTATAIIVAAGSGTRMGKDSNKQFILIDDIPVLAHTLLKFHHAETIDNIIIVTKPDFILTVSDLVREFGISKVKHIIPGGNTRQVSVNCGLAYADSGSFVAIHDGARPFITVEKINELVLTAHKFGAAAPGVVPKDTVKEIRGNSTIEATIDREKLRLIQTPQVFKANVLKTAFEKAALDSFVGTDDCSIAEHYGIEIKVIDGDYTNIKVTTPEDLPVAEAIYRFLNK